MYQIECHESVICLEFILCSGYNQVIAKAIYADVMPSLLGLANKVLLVVLLFVSILFLIEIIIYNM